MSALNFVERLLHCKHNPKYEGYIEHYVIKF